MRWRWILPAALVGTLGMVGVGLAASTNFVEPASSPEAVGSNPSGIAAADFDGDGDVDLATANTSASTVTVLRNGGTANFAEFASSPESVGSFPNSIAAGDLNGDASPDLAVTNQEGDSVTILLNNGNANFREPTSSPEPAGDSPVDAEIVNLDGDADLDLVVANALPTANLTVLRNSGTGNFNQPATSPESAGDKPVSVAAADVDGDGDHDLATANQQSHNVSILANNGTGNFAQLASSPEPAGTFPQGVAVGNLDGVTGRDLAVANQGSDNVTILRNNGAGDFNQPFSSPESVGDRPLSPPAVADFDLDADEDLAVANNNSGDVTILRNSGTANFAAPATSPELAEASAFAAVPADLDGDGDADLAVVNTSPSSNVTILRNR